MVEHPEVERTVEEFKSEEDILGYFNDETLARFKTGGALQKAS